MKRSCSAYYNEHDKFAAEWLRQLIRENLITPGEVDERDIQQVTASDLRGFTQCHFFAGIGVWSYALRCAGWPEDEPVWTGSCPCQPFSVSGKRAGASDERHLWPVWFPLIRESRPEHVFGEQVASDDGLAWLDLVSTDMEGQDYTLGAIDTPACGFGAPHRRQRLYWVAQSERVRLGGRRPDYYGRTEDARGESPERSDNRQSVEARGPIERVADSTGGKSSDGGLQRSGQHGQFAQDGGTVRLADTEHAGHDRARRFASLTNSDQSGERLLDGDSSAGKLGDSDEFRGSAPRVAGTSCETVQPCEGKEVGAAGGLSLNGFWRDAEWLWCRDKKYRPVEAGTFPLAHGIAKRVGKLRGYGNALVAPQAQAFVEAYLETSHEQTTGVSGRLTR